MTEKITKKDYFNAMLEILASDSDNHCYGDKGISVPAIREFIGHEVELLTKKNSRKPTKPTKSATETADVAEKILAEMPTDEKLTVTQIQNMIPDLATCSNQRVTSALKVLVNTGFVENTHEKGKSLFRKM